MLLKVLWRLFSFECAVAEAHGFSGARMKALVYEGAVVIAHVPEGVRVKTHISIGAVVKRTW